MALLALVLGGSLVASASGGPDLSASISWTFVGEGAPAPPPSEIGPLPCSMMPAGMWVAGTGTVTFFEEAGAHGTLNSMARGTATDNQGGSYQWNYHQSIQPLADGIHSRVVDQFGLDGSGAAGGIHSHFIAIIEGTNLEESTTFELLLLKGDPFTCDPL
jgi:hypothetical protein